jgi:hypothetical protein
MDGDLPSIMIDPEIDAEPFKTGDKVRCDWNGRVYFGEFVKGVNGFAIIDVPKSHVTVNVPIEIVHKD